MILGNLLENTFPHRLSRLGLLAGLAVSHGSDDNADSHTDEQGSEDRGVSVHELGWLYVLRNSAIISSLVLDELVDYVGRLGWGAQAFMNSLPISVSLYMPFSTPLAELALGALPVVELSSGGLISSPKAS